MFKDLRQGANKKQMIKAVIFDMDGVITDTVKYHYLSWKRLAEEENVIFTQEDNERLLGLSRPDSLTVFLKGRPISESKQAELLERKNRYFLKLIRNFSEKDLLPGVKELIEKLKNQGYKLAVASSSRNTGFILGKLKIDSLFDAIVDSLMVPQAKPAPDLFLKAASQIGEAPENCLVFEDSAAGVEAARRAGMATVGVGPAERVGKARFRFETMAEVDLEKIFI